MKAIGIERASNRLRNAAHHLDRLSQLSMGIDVSAFEYEWFLAISAINSAHEILRTTASKNPASRQWFGHADKNTIRKDALLRYVLHARGEDHHGLSTGAAINVSGSEYLGRFDDTPFAFDVEYANGETGTIGGPSIVLSGNPRSFCFSYRLIAVRDNRDGSIYDPPREHLGNALPDLDPTAIGRLAVAYYETLIFEAANFIKR